MDRDGDVDTIRANSVPPESLSKVAVGWYAENGDSGADLKSGDMDS